MSSKLPQGVTPLLLARGAGLSRLSIQHPTKPILRSLLRIISALAPLPVFAKDGVLARDIVLNDERRARAIECRVYASEKGEQLPRILFSHGFDAAQGPRRDTAWIYKGVLPNPTTTP